MSRKLTPLSSLATSIVMGVGLILSSSPVLAAPGVVRRVNYQQPRLSGFVYPVMGTVTTSSFGVRLNPFKNRRSDKRAVSHHHGIDLAAPTGTTIRSIAPGRVVFADRYGGYGKLIVIQHAGGITSHYGHCHSIAVKTGSAIKAGAIIGTVGSTGRSTGPHLHFEIRRDGTPISPEKLLPGL